MNIQLLKQAQQEIIQLRRRNEVLQAKVDVIDTFGIIAHQIRRNGGECCSEDIAWSLGRLIAELEETPKANLSPEVGPIKDL